MYETDNTIAAISSGSLPGARQIIRLSGSSAVDSVNEIFTPALDPSLRKAITGKVSIRSLDLDAVAYTFPDGRSYTGEQLIELHIVCCPAVAEAILESLLKDEVRLAGPGEFTARAYLNGRIDLSQAEAVSEIVASSNKFQLEAAEKLLQGKLSDSISDISNQLLDLMSLLEAELDFSEEETMFVTQQQAIKMAGSIQQSLNALLNENIRYEATIGLPSVGIAGSPNAGKSLLLNSLTGQQRSIVSGQRATTRDILTAELSLKNNDCILFDCAGLSIANKVDILDEIAQQSAITAINSASLVLFCVDISSDDFNDDIALLNLITVDNIVFLATKSDLLTESQQLEKLQHLKKLCSKNFIPASSVNKDGLETIKQTIDENLLGLMGKLGDESETIAVTQRHKRFVENALENLNLATQELHQDSNEIAAMYLRDALESLFGLKQVERVDEQMLERIFSKFCIGK